MIRSFKKTLASVIPAPLWVRILSSYHLSVALLSALFYGFPSRRIIVVGVTGTKGKSSTTEMIRSICESHGWRTAVLNSIRIKIDTDSRANTMRMSMPGRFFIQSFLAKAVSAGCEIAIIEMTSEGARQHRARGIAMDALVFLNLAPEHIESHGSLQAYADAKYALGLQLMRSHKRPRTMVANADDSQGSRYLALQAENAVPFSLSANAPYTADERGGFFTFKGEKVSVHIAGEFSLKNALAAATLADALGITIHSIIRGLDALRQIPGRAEEIREGQTFTVVVDYAHTPDSLEALYQAYRNKKKICILGSTGGGRDTWKRPIMGALAEKYCDTVILTNEDPYDETPESIVGALSSKMTKTPLVIMNRRSAIAEALAIAKTLGESAAVLITGKGTDPTIQGPGGTSVPWSDAAVAREEIKKGLVL